MKQATTALFLFASLGCAAPSGNDKSMVYGFDTIIPSTDLKWTPCFDDFTCARLEVPLDYSNRKLGTTSVPFIKLAGKNATTKTKSIVITAGGPGSSGVDLLLSSKGTAGYLFGEEYNLVSFDARGVNNSALGFDCFSGNTEAREAFNRLYSTGATNVSSSSLAEQFEASSIYGKWCNDAVKSNATHGYYVTTPAVARDLLSFTEAEARLAGEDPSKAKLWSYGVSYGTTTGQTFASMFPDRVGRMVLDGIMDADNYYNNDWRDEMEQSDETMGNFSSSCYSAGPEKCSFWGPSPVNITTRLNNIVSELQSRPVPVNGLPGHSTPALVTYSDLKTLFISALYTPYESFPSMADALHWFEQGNVSALVGLSDALGIPAGQDPGFVIRCVDSYRRNKIATIEGFKTYVEYVVSKSKYIGDIWPIYAKTVVCESVQPELPDSMVFQGSIGSKKQTAFPILFTSNTLDPITPLQTARKMSTKFPGSVILMQDALGHTVMNQGGSTCYFEHVQAYFKGDVPKTNTLCASQYTPFINTPTQ